MANLQKINNNIGTYLGNPMQHVNSVANPVIGNIYLDAKNHQYMIYTGTSWVTLTDESSWSINNGSNIKEEEVLVAKHPGLAELKRELDEAKEKYAAFYALCKE